MAPVNAAKGLVLAPLGGRQEAGRDQGAIAKAAGKGAFHKKTASRKISRLTKRVNTLKA